jgi:peptide/nickel transport system permease protein
MAGADAALAQGSEPPGAVGVSQILGRRTTRSEFLHSKRVVSGLGIIVVMVLFSFVGPLIYHTNQVAVNLADVNLPPANGHPLGTDIYGTDVLGRLMVGGRSSLELSLSVAIVSTFIGAVYGATSGMLGGMMDGLQMRIVDTIQAIPSFILLLIIASMYTLDLATIIVVLSVLSWAGVARLVRAHVLVLRETDFVRAATIQGATRRWILYRHILPNTFNIIVVTATFAVADAIYALSALSFLGLGPQPPFADWGTMLTQGVNNLFDGYWWQVYPPLIALVVTVLAFRQIGDAVNDIFHARVSVR